MKCCEDFKNRCWKFWKKNQFLCKILFSYIELNFLVMKYCEDLKIVVGIFEKKFNSYVFYFVMKWCEDFKNIVEKMSILMYLIILWWNDVRISKIIVEKLWKILLFMYFIILWWNDVRISKITVKKFEKFESYNITIFEILTAFHHWIIEYISYIFYYLMMKCCEDFKNRWWKIEKSSNLMYSIMLWWNDGRISKFIIENVEKF